MSLSETSLNPVRFNFRSFGGTALEQIDYFDALGTAVIPAGQTSVTIRIQTKFDNLDETDEPLWLELTNAENGVFANGEPTMTALGIIRDDDGGSDLSLIVTNPKLVEGNAGTKNAIFEIHLSRPELSPLTFNYETANGSAIAGQDYTAQSGTVTFLPGQTVAVVEVPVIGNQTIEPSEFFSLVVTPTPEIASGVETSTGVALVLDEDTGAQSVPTLTIQRTETVESSTAAFPQATFIEYVVTLSRPATNAVRFDYRTVGGNDSKEQIDYFSGFGTAMIPAGDTSITLRIQTKFDTLNEADEAVWLELSNPLNAVFAGGEPTIRSLGIIKDDDGGPDLSLFVSSPTLVEGNSGTRNAVFEVHLSRPHDSALTFDYATSNGTAIAGQDYTAKSGSITFEPGQTMAAVEVPVIGNLVIEPSELFSLVVTPTAEIVNEVEANVGTATILDEDTGAQAVPTLTVQRSEAIESATAAFPDATFIEYVVTLSRPATNTVTFNYLALGGTAQTEIDFFGAKGTASIPAGESSVTIRIQTKFDTLDEADETVWLEVSNVKNAIIAGTDEPTTRALGIIKDDDGIGSNLSLFVSSPKVVEGDSGSKSVFFEVHLSRPHDAPLTLSYTTANGTAVAGQDYTGKSGTITFQPGQTTVAVEVAVHGDLTVEGNETFSLVVTPTPDIANGVQANTGIAAIRNNDVPAPPPPPPDDDPPPPPPPDDDDPPTPPTDPTDEDPPSPPPDDDPPTEVPDLTGGPGRDKLVGGRGSDVLKGRGGNDKLDGKGGKDTLKGGGGKDKLDGGGGSDALKGGGGKDQLCGEKGKDELKGGGGKDKFVFKSLKDSKNNKKDLIQDFKQKQNDKVVLKKIDAEKGKGNQKFDFIGEDRFTDTEGELRIDIRKNKTFIYGDVDGDGRADFTIKLKGDIDLKLGDFIL